MKHCYHRLVLSSIATLLALPSALRADVVVMKDGKKYDNATVMSETPETVTFKYWLTPKIPDTRTEPKSAVAQITRQKPEEVELTALRKEVPTPTPDLLTADKYESIIQDTLRPFVNKYPGTPQAKEVEELINTLQGEKEKVIGGSLKMEGEWINSDMVKRDSHSIDAYRVRRDMNALANLSPPAGPKYREALIEWQKMSDPDEGYTDTLQYVKAVPEVLEILANYKKELDRMIREQPDLMKRRNDGLSKMLPSDPLLARTKRAIDAETAAFKTETDVDKKSHVRWLSVYKYDMKSLQVAVKNVIDETAKLRVLDLIKLTTQNEALVAATRYLADGNVEQTEAALARANAVSGTHISNKSIQTLRTRLATLKTEKNAQRRAQRVYGTGNVGAVTTGTAATTDARVAEAFAANEKAKAEKKEMKMADKPEGDTTAPEATDEAKPAAKTTHDKPKKTVHHTTTASAASVEMPPSDDESGGITKYLYMGGGGLLAVLLTVMFLQKRKNK